VSEVKQYFAALLILCALIETGFALPSVAETTPPGSKAGAPESSLPVCVNLESDIAKIQDVQKANHRTPAKYDGYRKILHENTVLELAARLVYAETVAANCPEQEDRIVDLVALVIGNRIRIRRGDVRSVVFQRDQFASSLNIYPESRYRDFLCPNNEALWKKALTKMRVNLEGAKPSAPIPKDAVNYYLYQHSDRFKAPAWKLEEVLVTDEKTRECIRVFRDPAWR
jgi:hypothetical protein